LLAASSAAEVAAAVAMVNIGGTIRKLSKKHAAAKQVADAKLLDAIVLAKFLSRMSTA
jgi:hypothetical protein